ncbi:MAG: P-loop NTPase fold protein [Planctomycetota bacterium]
MSTSADTKLTADGMPVFAYELCDDAAQAASYMLLEEGKSTLRTALVTGSHGAGKTTQLKLIDSHLRRAGAGVSWFNGWAHKEDVDPFASLLFALWDQLDIKGEPQAPVSEQVDGIVSAAMRRKGYPSNTGMHTRDSVDAGERSLLVASDLIAQLVVRDQPLAELAHASKLLSDSANLNEDRYRQQKLLERSRSYLFPKRFREQMDMIITHLRHRQTDPHLPCFLFVDDLDRCPPALGLALLEAAGRFFAVPGLVVVVALDEVIARSWVRSAYEGNVDGRAYIDKLFDRRILGTEERARVIWAQLLGVEWRMAEWEGLVGKAHPEMADRAVISATRLLRIHSGSDIRKVRRTLNEVRTIILEDEEYLSKVTLMPDVVRLGVLCGYLVRERFPRIVERISDLRLLEARMEVVEEMMTIAPNWELPDDDDDSLAWLREFLGLTPEEERELGYILDIRHFLPTDVLIQVGSQLVLIGMGLR